MPSSSLRSFEYLETLPGLVFNRLYEQPSTALAIFRRMLPHLAKTFVMAMLFASQPLALVDLESWVKPESTREKEHALSLLARLHILASVTQANRAQTLELTNPFATSLRRALTGGGNHQSFGVPSATPSAHPVSIDTLDAYARSQWEGILYFVVGSAGVGDQSAAQDPSPAVKQLLVDSGLIEVTTLRRVEITQAGFSFLLQEINAQVWTILINYLESAGERGLEPVEILSFLFTLGSLELGQDYSTAPLSNTQSTMLADLADFGIVYLRTPTSSRYYPTRLATTLTSDAGALRSVSAGFDHALTQPSTTSTASGTAGDARGFIIIETNYRLYAYTSSPLQIAVLSLFTNLSTCYPNMVTGRITRESIRRAIGTGITADQIVTYLTTHAHPQMRRAQGADGNTGGTAGATGTGIGAAPILPPTVIDQIRLWQMENERMTATEGYLFRDFVSQEEYEVPCKYADEIGVLVWKNASKRMFFVTKVEMVAELLKRKAAAKKAGK